jgi:hypothetical protein
MAPLLPFVKATFVIRPTLSAKSIREYFVLALNGIILWTRRLGQKRHPASVLSQSSRLNLFCLLIKFNMVLIR